MSNVKTRNLLQELSGQLSQCRQNHLLNESRFLSFCKARSIPIFGVIKGDPGKFIERGLLLEDGRDCAGSPLFHPFRFYACHEILDILAIPLARSSFLDREAAAQAIERRICDWLPSDDELNVHAFRANSIVDLAVLLEPVYWPQITGVISRSALIDQDDTNILEYSRIIKEHIQTLDPEEWRARHESLRLRAADIDDNGSLYLLLRLSSWHQRQKLTGRISLAMWIRHIAELIRLAFEDLHDVQWDEEDWAHGTWAKDGRKISYGFDRPLDHPKKAQPRVAFLFRLATGSSVRWYVEGETEYHAVRYLIPDCEEDGIELVNLRGNIALAKNNIAMRLSDALVQDLAHRRFSIISFDADVDANKKFIQKQISEGRVVGYIEAHAPDFELANFAITELVEVVCEIDKSFGFSAAQLADATWHDIRTGKQFEKRYCELSLRRPRCLKGEAWGRCLAEYARKFPLRSDNKLERPLIKQVRLARLSRTAHYDFQKESLYFDPQSFQLQQFNDKSSE